MKRSKTRTDRFVNWSGVHAATPRSIVFPSSEQEVASIVATARDAGQLVRVVGAGHSWSPLVLTDDVLISLDRMDRVLSVDTTALTVTVEAGIRLEAVNAALELAGLAIPVLGSIAKQSVAGVISTGTHGTGVKYGNLSTLVVSMRLVRSDGSIHEISASSGEVFDAARLSLGALGVITRVTLRLERAFRLRERVELVPFAQAIRDLDAIAHTDEHVKLWWLPHTDRVRVAYAGRTTAPTTKPPRVFRAIDQARGLFGTPAKSAHDLADGLLNRHVFSGLLAASRRRPALTPRINQLVLDGFREGERVDVSHRIFNLAMPPVHREAEFGVPMPHAGGVLDRLRQEIDRRGLHVNFIVEVRFVAADELWLSGSYQRLSCQIGAYIGESPSRAPYFELFEDLCQTVDGRPHWGKEFAVDSRRIATVFPEARRFASLCRDWDPSGTFANPFVRSAFAL